MKIGITGHQRLESPDSWAWVEQVMSEQLQSLAPPLMGVTSLAVGADQLLAKLITRIGGRIYAVIPFRGYERSFDAEGLTAYRSYLSKAVSVEVLDTPGTDEDAYLAAGKRVVDLADLLIAVWDGRPAKGKGGTADIVAFAQQRHVPLIHINPSDRSIVHAP
jgi:hypothetical protein